ELPGRQGADYTPREGVGQSAPDHSCQDGERPLDLAFAAAPSLPEWFLDGPHRIGAEHLTGPAGGTPGPQVAQLATHVPDCGHRGGRRHQWLEWKGDGAVAGIDMTPLRRPVIAEGDG